MTASGRLEGDNVQKHIEPKVGSRRSSPWFAVASISARGLSSRTRPTTRVSGAFFRTSAWPPSLTLNACGTFTGSRSLATLAAVCTLSSFAHCHLPTSRRTWNGPTLSATAAGQMLCKHSPKTNKTTLSSTARRSKSDDVMPASGRTRPLTQRNRLPGRQTPHCYEGRSGRRKSTGTKPTKYPPVEYLPVHVVFFRPIRIVSDVLTAIYFYDMTIGVLSRFYLSHSFRSGDFFT